jgi:hypothetical protein
VNQLKKILVEVWDEDIIGDRDFLGEFELDFDDIGAAMSTQDSNKALMSERETPMIASR